MECPKCGNDDTKVIDSRSSDEGESIRRRRKCESCDFRFTTYERHQIQLPTIVKNDGRRETFNREKVLRGLKKACQKRPVSIDQLNQLIDEVEQFLITRQGAEEIKANEVGEAVMAKLKELDPVSFVRFASFYWDYQNVQDFVKTLQKDFNFRLRNRSPKETEIHQ
jgi:transcriptional repressor NrdR